MGIPELNVALKNKNFTVKGGKAFINNIPVTTIVKNFNSGNMGLVLKNLKKKIIYLYGAIVIVIIITIIVYIMIIINTTINCLKKKKQKNKYYLLIIK